MLATIKNLRFRIGLTDCINLWSDQKCGTVFFNYCLSRVPKDSKTRSYIVRKLSTITSGYLIRRRVVFNENEASIRFSRGNVKTYCLQEDHEEFCKDLANFIIMGDNISRLEIRTNSRIKDLTIVINGSKTAKIPIILSNDTVDMNHQPRHIAV